MSVMRFLCLALALVLGPYERVSAHALEPGYLEITSLAGDNYHVFWRKPDVQGQPMILDVLLPTNCETRRGPTPRNDGRAWSARWLTQCPGGLAGGILVIEGLAEQQTDVLVRYDLAPNQTFSERMTPQQSSFLIPEDAGAWDVLATYLPLGIEHILEGADHLFFIFALLLLVTNRWRLLGAITAFTVAHSITMAAATLGWVTLPSPPVEAIIALSIMFVASELVLRNDAQQRWSQRYPWTVSFSFGLLHGFGFAGALLEIGLPQADIPLALLSFNLGVEAGQLVFVAAVLAFGFALKWVWPSVQRLIDPKAAVGLVGAYVIGGWSAYWFLDRLIAF